MKGYEAVHELLDAVGVRTVFTYISEDNMELFADVEMDPDSDMQMVHTRHEQGAMTMADAYSRAGDRMGVCLVGRGPAIAQTGTALVNAQNNGSRLLVIVPTPSQDDLHDPKEFDQTKYLESTVGSVVTVGSDRTLIHQLSHAIRQLHQGDGPVAVQIPKGILKSTVEDADEQLDFDTPRAIGIDNPRSHSEPRLDPKRIEPDPDQLEEAVDRYLDSDAFRPPVILVGEGAVAADAKASIEALAERLNAVLLTTLKARNLFSDHPYAVGFNGNWGEPLSNEFLADANYVLAVGCSLNNHTVDDGYLLDDDATVIHIDANPKAIGEYTSVDLGIVGDAGRTADALDRAFEDAGIDRGDDLWDESLRERIADYSALDTPEYPEKPDAIDPRKLAEAFDSILPEQRLVGSDGGNFRRWVLHALSTPPEHSRMSCDFAAIGLGLSTGIGLGQYLKDNVTKYDRTDERVAVTFCGDGGFMMALQEVETAARHEIPVVIIVGNDSSLGSEYHFLEVEGFPPELARLTTPNIARVAEELGAEGHRIRTLDDLEAVADRLETPDGPIVLECIIDHEIRHHMF